MSTIYNNRMVKSRVTTINNGQYGFISVRMRLNVKDLKYSRVYGKLIAITPFLLLPSCVDLLHVLQCIFTNTFQKKEMPFRILYLVIIYCLTITILYLQMDELQKAAD